MNKIKILRELLKILKVNNPAEYKHYIFKIKLMVGSLVASVLGVALIWYNTNGWTALGAFLFMLGNNITMSMNLENRIIKILNS